VTEVLYNATVYKNEDGQVQGIFAAARDVTERKRTEEALRESESRLRFLSSQLLKAHESERKRIAAELHDSIAASLSGIKFSIEATVGRMKQDVAVVEPLKVLVSRVQQTIEETRRIMADLRPSVLDDLGILAAISWLCREFQRVYSHIDIEKQAEIEESEVPDSLKTVIYRIAQEALNNIAKHSKASLVRLSLRKTDGKIELMIRDNGTGFDPKEAASRVSSQRGLGLSSMKERAELAGGLIAIKSVVGEGTIIHALWPA
jgi:signal transduction histidine kinase